MSGLATGCVHLSWRFSSLIDDLQLHSFPLQVKDGLVLPDKASLYLTAIEDADYKADKIECKLIPLSHFVLDEL